MKLNKLVAQTGELLIFRRNEASFILTIYGETPIRACRPQKWDKKGNILRYTFPVSDNYTGALHKHEPFLPGFLA